MKGYKYTTEQIADALSETKGMITLAARRVGCSPNTIRAYIARDKVVTAAQKEAFEQMGDAVELALYDEAIKKRNIAALIFLAKTKYKDRGYVERQQIELDGSVTVKAYVGLNPDTDWPD